MAATDKRHGDKDGTPPNQFKPAASEQGEPTANELALPPGEKFQAEAEMTQSYDAIGWMRGQIERNRCGEQSAVYCSCTANKHAIRATLEQGKRDGVCVIIEATVNQVNPYDGYWGKDPAVYANMVRDLAREVGFPMERVILGGDHLGPIPWKIDRSKPEAGFLTSEEAMLRAEETVEKFVEAGFLKIHLDLTPELRGDPENMTAEDRNRLIAQRTARLAAVVVRTWKDMGEPQPHPALFLGSEVPPPGGDRDAHGGQHITTVEDLSLMMSMSKEEFERAGVGEAFGWVCGVIAEIGVEFDKNGASKLFDPTNPRVKQLSEAVVQFPNVAIEEHSSDYQGADRLTASVMMHAAILKVGPALTFAAREQLGALERIEAELIDAGMIPEGNRSNLKATAIGLMWEDQYQKYWRRDYQGTDGEITLQMWNSPADRIRYIMPDPRFVAAEQRLFDNLRSVEIPRGVLSAHAKLPPHLLEAVLAEDLKPDPEDLVSAWVGFTIDGYAQACGMTTRK